MKYILDQEEMNEIAELRKQLKRFPSVDTLQLICTKAANEWPVKFWGRKEATPWGCVITEEGEGHEWYCDECPVKEICPYPHKRYSK